MIPVRAYIELIKIASLEGVNRSDGIEARENALKEWLKEWVEEVTDSQSIIKTNISLEEQDIVKYYLAGKLAEELMQDCVTIEEQPTKITTKIAAFRRDKS